MTNSPLSCVGEVFQGGVHTSRPGEDNAAVVVRPGRRRVPLDDGAEPVDLRLLRGAQRQ